MAGEDGYHFATPTLMRSARGAYAQSIRAELDAVGIDDLPRDGALLLAGIDDEGGLRHDLPSELGVTKQAVSQLLDVLVRRGYLERRPDPVDRRRVVLELTDRGDEVVEATRLGVEAVNRELARRVSPKQIDALRAVLIALTEIKVQGGGADESRRRRPSRQLHRFSPIFPVRDLEPALAHYSALGFDTLAHDGSQDYGFADRDGTGLHLVTVPADEALHPAAAYLYVRDADALYEEWCQPGIGGQTHPVSETPYKLREGSHLDPYGNLLRFGSPTGERATDTT
jgi:DNA-binding MarR family transcriptional regulator